MLFCYRFTYCQVYDDNLKPIGHPDEYLDITQYDEYDLGDVFEDEVDDGHEHFNGYWRVVNTSIVPFQPIIDEPIQIYY